MLNFLAWAMVPRNALRIIGSLALAILGVVLLQRTPLALFAPEHTENITGFASGLLVGMLVFWVIARWPARRPQRPRA